MPKLASHRFDNSKRRRSDDHDRQVMLTPAYVLEPIRTLLGGIGLDPCTEPDNPTKAKQWYSLPDDGCVLPWNAPSVFCNPPYGQRRNRWVSKCIAEADHGTKIVLLMPSQTETQVFQRALKSCSSMMLIQSRLRFTAVRSEGRHEAASHGSALLGFNLDLSSLETSIAGTVLIRSPLCLGKTVKQRLNGLQ